MKDQKDEQYRFIFHSQFWSYLPGVTFIVSTTVYYYYFFIYFYI